MSFEQTKNAIVALWQSGKKGKGIIIGAVVVALGIIGSFMDSSSPERAAVATSSETAKNAVVEPKGSLAKKDVAVASKGKSIMTVRDLSGDYACRGLVEKMFKYDFRSPITEDMAVIDQQKKRFSLFGGDLRIGAEIDLPENVTDETLIFSINLKKYKLFDDAETDACVFINGPNCSERLIDGTKVWRMDNLHVKKFLELGYVEDAYWYQAPGSRKLVLFYAMVKRDKTGSSKEANEIRQKFITAIIGKYPDAKKTFSDSISDEYLLNGDLITVEQSAKNPTGFFDYPYVKVGIITPSIVAKVLKSIDDSIAKYQKDAADKEAHAMDNF